LKILRDTLFDFVTFLKRTDRKTNIIIVSVLIIQTLSWYFTSRRFFRENIFYQYFEVITEGLFFEYLYWFIGDSLTFILLPILIIYFVLKEKPADYGFRFGDIKQGLLLTIIAVMFMVPVIWFASSTTSFVEQYPHLPTARISWNTFFIYEFALLIYMTGWEFIWRGFMLNGLYEKFGNEAIFIQAIPFVILHNGKPFMETLGAIPGAILLGFIALRVRSFYYCVLIHFSVIFLMDLNASLRFRAQEFGYGPEAFFNLFF